MSLPLSGIRVLDLTSFLAGPFGSMILGDLGAEVIRIEHPLHPETARTSPPHFLGGESLFFLSLNRNKKSMTLDLKQEEGLQVFYDLVKTADVVYDNFRAGVTDKLKVDQNTLKAINPGIVCCSLSGFGKTGPLSDRPGYDYVMQGISGLMSLAGEPGSPPQKTGISMVDHVGGLYAVIAVLASLAGKHRTGTGLMTDVALLDGSMSLLSYVAAYYMNAGDVPKKIAASGHPSYVPAQNFETADGYIVVTAFSEKFWRATCRAIGKPEWLDDPRFLMAKDRFQHKQELLDMMIPLLKTQPSAYWLDAMEREDVPCSPINDVPRGLEHPQVRAREMVVDITHPTAGTLKVIGNPIKIPGEDPVYAPPPLHGEHTDLILSSLGYTQERIDGLRQKQVIR